MDGYQEFFPFKLLKFQKYFHTHPLQHPLKEPFELFHLSLFLSVCTVNRRFYKPSVFECLFQMLCIIFRFVFIVSKTSSFFLCSVHGILRNVLHDRISVVSTLFFIFDEIVQHTMSYKRSDIT